MIFPYRSNLDRSRYETNLRNPVDHPIMKELRNVPVSISHGTQIKLISELYEDSNPLSMLDHPAIIIIPYQVSTINLIELYRLNIPTFCPSLSLLKEWCREYDIMWESHYGWPETISSFYDIPDPNGTPNMDKNSTEWEKMFDYWMPLADFYQNKVGLVYFDSWEDFFHKYHKIRRNGQLDNMHLKMKKENERLRKKLVERWKRIIARVRKSK